MSQVVDVGGLLEACEAFVAAVAQVAGGETPETAIDADRALQAAIELLFVEVTYAQRAFEAQGVRFKVLDPPKGTQ